MNAGSKKVDIYSYDDVDVLINKFNIKNEEKLSVIERKLSSLRTSIFNTIYRKKVKVFDFNFLKVIHEYLFQDIYDFAGKIRIINIAKGSTMFCKPEFIESQGIEIFDKLKNEKYFVGTNKSLFIKKMAEFMGDINMLHPFREGNGRAQRVLFELIANNAEYTLNIQDWEPNDQINADIDAAKCNYEKLISLISKHIEKYNGKDYEPIQNSLQSKYKVIDSYLIK